MNKQKIDGEKTEEGWVHKPFGVTVSDLGKLFKLYQNSSEEFRSPLSRALVVNQVIMLEGIANTIIWSIDPNNEMISANDQNSNNLLASSLERLSLIQKLNFALFLRSRRQLSEGNHLVKHIKQDLVKKHRDPWIHPKVTKSKFKSIEQDKETGVVKFSTKKTPWHLTKEDTTRHLKLTFQFVDEYLLRWCNCEETFLFRLLSDESELKDNQRQVFNRIDLIEAKEVLEAGLGIKIKFLSFVQASLSPTEEPKEKPV